jgi:hypothetical protein
MTNPTITNTVFAGGAEEPTELSEADLAVVLGGNRFWDGVKKIGRGVLEVTAAVVAVAVAPEITLPLAGVALAAGIDGLEHVGEGIGQVARNSNGWDGDSSTDNSTASAGGYPQMGTYSTG